MRKYIPSIVNIMCWGLKIFVLFGSDLVIHEKKSDIRTYFVNTLDKRHHLKLRHAYSVEIKRI